MRLSRHSRAVVPSHPGWRTVPTQPTQGVRGLTADGKKMAVCSCNLKRMLIITRRLVVFLFILKLLCTVVEVAVDGSSQTAASLRVSSGPPHHLPHPYTTT